MIRMLTDQIRGKNSSWFIRWHASLFLSGKLTLQPGRSFIRNIGTDDSGTHCDTTKIFEVVPHQAFVGLPLLEISEDRRAVEEIRFFFERSRSRHWYRRLLRHILDQIHLRKIIRYG